MSDTPNLNLFKLAVVKPAANEGESPTISSFDPTSVAGTSSIFDLDQFYNDYTRWAADARSVSSLWGGGFIKC